MARRGNTTSGDAASSSALSETELQAFLTLTEELLVAHEPEDVARALLEFAVSTYGFPRGAVLAGPTQRLQLMTTHGVDAESTRSPGASPAAERAHAQGAPQVVGPPHFDPWITRLMPADADVLVLSLAADERQVGALLLQIPAVLTNAGRQRVLEQLAHAGTYASQALHRVSRLQHLQRLVTTDDLTMIANRRGFTAALERELARSARTGEPLSLVLLDIDHFKSVNDTFGHPAGDEALRNVAAALSIACRELDTAARYGGEEFAVIVPACSLETAVGVAERMRQAVASAPAARPLTASAGVATYPDHARDVDDLVAAADDALLISKRSGRNQTTAYAPQRTS